MTGKGTNNMKRNDITSLAATACLAAALAMPPAAMAAGTDDKINPRMTPGQVTEIMQEAGYAAYIDKDGEGDPMIIAKSDEGKFGAIFFDCEKKGPLADRFCTDLEFTAIFEIDRKPPLAKLNEWNAKQAFGKTYLDKDGDLALQMPVNLANGVSKSFVVSSLEWWQAAMAGFNKHMWPK
jgi:hypothetical protein